MKRSDPVIENHQFLLRCVYQYDPLGGRKDPHVYSLNGVTVSGETKEVALEKLTKELRRKLYCVVM